MAWNWQQSGWPLFQWNAEALKRHDAPFLQNVGVQIGTARHFDDATRELVLVDMLTGEAIKTSEIEGEILNRESVQSSILGHFGYPSEQKRVSPAERGISELMVDLHNNFDQELTDETLFKWHRMVSSGRSDLTAIGVYRSQGDPMQVVSGAIYKPKVHFEAPPASEMQSEMTAFISWFSETGPKGAKPLPPLVRAGIAHLYFVSIHPFEDGNGRIARALAEKVLAQSIGRPTLLALSQTIQLSRNAYYDALEQNNKVMEITAWLDYFCRIVIDAQVRSQRLIDFLIEKTKFFNRMRGQLNDRQHRALQRLFREGPDGFKGGLSAAKYITITGAARATATRDLSDLVEKGALVQTGALKSTRYWLAVETLPVRRDSNSALASPRMDSLFT
jgi:Fic family protein